MATRKLEKFQFHTRGKTFVFVDWANVFNWSKRTKWEIDIEKFFHYWESYESISRRTLFFGSDEHKKSKTFLEICEKVGWEVCTKPVKYIDDRRKCDFDVEITTEMLLNLNDYQTFILFSGDGDYAYPIQKILEMGKRVFVVGSKGAIGREYFDMRKNKIHPILVDIGRLKKDIEI